MNDAIRERRCSHLQGYCWEVLTSQVGIPIWFIYLDSFRHLFHTELADSHHGQSICLCCLSYGGWSVTGVYIIQNTCSRRNIYAGKRGRHSSGCNASVYTLIQSCSPKDLSSWCVSQTSWKLQSSQPPFVFILWIGESLKLSAIVELKNTHVIHGRNLKPADGSEEDSILHNW